jgi:hypothetical protein
MAKLKFVQVKRKVLLADVVIGADDAALKQTPEILDIVGMDFAAHIFARPMSDSFMLKSVQLQIAVTAMLIGSDQINFLADGLTNEAIERARIGILNHLADHVAFSRNSSDHRSLTAHAGNVLLFVPMAVLVLAAKSGFVDFHDAHQFAKPIVGESGAEPMTHEPSRAIRAASDHPVDLQSTNTLLASKNQIQNLEPDKQLVIGVLEHSANRNREPIGSALRRTALHALPVERALSALVNLRVSAARTLNTFRPALHSQVELARRFVREHSVEIGKRHLAGNRRFAVFPCVHALNLAHGGALVKSGIIALVSNYEEPSLACASRMKWLAKVQRLIAACSGNRESYKLAAVACSLAYVGDVCRPSIDYIAAQAGCVPNTVKACIAWLEEHGALTWSHTVRKHRNGRMVRSSNLYTFILDFGGFEATVARTMRAICRERPRVSAKGNGCPGLSQSSRYTDCFDAQRRLAEVAKQRKTILLAAWNERQRQCCPLKSVR